MTRTFILPLAFGPVRRYVFTMNGDKTQSFLFDTPRPGSNLPEFGVAEISRLLKKAVEEGFGLVRIRGEISECKYHSNGHIYLTLKEDTTSLAAVCWRGSIGRLGIKPEVGMEVICTGRLTTYMSQSKYQLVIEGMALAGMGALLKMLEERRKKLAAEGLFDLARKQLLPYLPEVIGVVTSPSGAVIRDILHRLANRFPRHVIVWPVAVQGIDAATQIAAAIEGFNMLPEGGAVPRPDVIIVARGGGSVEDLMAFNEEIVVRAAAASGIPLISAVGHETDTTLIDFAADVRAPTPTAAAEMAVPVRDDLLGQVIEYGIRLWQGMSRKVDAHADRLDLLSRALGDPARAIEPITHKLESRTARLVFAWQSYHERRRAGVAEAGGRLRHPRDVLKLSAQHLRHLEHKMHAFWRESFLRRVSRVETFGSVLDHLSPRAVLGRGYALVQGPKSGVSTSAKKLKKGSKVGIEFHDGRRKAVIEE